MEHIIQDTDLSAVDVDPKKFVLGDWLAGASRVTRSVEVCGKPQLQGEIEEIKLQLERPQPEGDDRPHVKDPNVALARRLEELREEMLASVVTWKFIGLDDDQIKRIRDAVPAEAVAEAQAAGVPGELDYRIWAAQVVSVAGEKVTVEWEQLRRLHQSLGNYFSQTIGRTANKAQQAEGVDVPFSLRSSSLIAKSSSR